MTSDYLEVARRRLADLRRTETVTRFVRAAECEKSEISEESPPAEGLISHVSLISQSVPTRTDPDEALSKARRRVRELRRAALDATTHCEKSEISEISPSVPSPPTDDGGAGSSCEESEKRSAVPSPPASEPTPALLADPFRAWRLRNAELLTDDDRRLRHDRGGFCATHNRWLTYPEQRRGACSWCVPVDPEREPEYWQSHWRRFTERR